MSYNHENVIWQSKDGTWNRGFYAEDYLTCGGNEDECGDETHEWCREFDRQTFQWVSVGHRSEDAAGRAWDGANPGSSDHHRPYADLDESARAEIEDLEDMAAALCEREQEHDRNQPRSRWGGWRAYNGPPKTRSLKAIQKQRDNMRLTYFGHRLGGYGNMLDPREKDLTAKIEARLASATPEEVDAYEARDAEHRDAMRQYLAQHRQAKIDAARRRRSYGSHFYDSGAAQRLRAEAEREQAAEDHIAKADAAAAERIAARKPKAAPEKAPPPPRKAPAARATPTKVPAKPKPSAGTGATKRVGKGVPTGGQFAASARGESGVSLAPTPPPPPAAGPVDPVTSSSDFADWGDDPWG